MSGQVSFYLGLLIAEIGLLIIHCSPPWSGPLKWLIKAVKWVINAIKMRLGGNDKQCKRAFKWGSIIIVCGLIISGIAYLGHKQPFDPMSPIEESTANRDVLTRKSFNKIKVTASSADVIIKQGNHFTVSYYGNKNHAVHAQVKDGVLKITQTPVTHSKLAKFQLLNSSDEERCIVTVPQKASLLK